MLVRQLQEQHYEQYMRQVQQQQLFPEATQDQSQQNGQSQSNEASNNASVSVNQVTVQTDVASDGVNRSPVGAGAETVEPTRAPDEEEDKTDNEDRSSQIAAASMWTRKDVKEFKDTVKAEGGEAIIRVGQGESVTVSPRCNLPTQLPV